jgi:hypothetical protein
MAPVKEIKKTEARNSISSMGIKVKRKKVKGKRRMRDYDYEL